MAEAREAAQRRLREAEGKVYAAFDSLDLFTHRDALEEVYNPVALALDEFLPHKNTGARVTAVERLRGRLVGIALGLAIEAVEADRQRRSDSGA